MPSVSLVDFALKTNDYVVPAVPGTTFGANANGVKGWDWNLDENGVYVEDPYLKFDLLEWLISKGKITFENYASYLMVPLVGQIAAAQ